MIRKLRHYPVASAFLIGLLFLLYLHPGFLFLQTTPMGSKSWELRDSVVSYIVFSPARETVKYELFENGQLLWSSLKGLGMPLLGNEIQGAPLSFPALLLSWMPSPYYWGVLGIMKLILMAAGAFLFGRRVIGFQPVGALFFAFNLTYALFVMRWINHPWHHSWVVGIWYLYFLSLMLQRVATGNSKSRLKWWLGSTLMVYTLLTSGFPEGMLMVAILTFMVQLPLVIQHMINGWKQADVPKAAAWKRYIGYALSSHMIGFALASPQLFSLFELMGTTISTRGSFGLTQFGSLKALLHIVTPFGERGPDIHPQILIGLIPCLLMGIGLFETLKHRQRWSVWDISALSIGTFYLLKAFPFWPAFNQFVGSLPMLRDSWFLPYFSSLLHWTVAYYAARGIEAYTGLFNYQDTQARQQKLWLLIISVFFWVALVFLIAPFATKTSYLNVLESYPIGRWILVNFILFGIFLGIQTMLSLKQRVQPKKQMMLIFLLLASMVIEYDLSRPKRYYDLQEFDRHFIGTSDLDQSLEPVLKKHGLTLHESRLWEGGGRFAQFGLASMENGSPALIPQRSKTLRNVLFDVPWKGHLPIRKPRYSYSFQLISNNLYLEDHLRSFNIPKESLQSFGVVDFIFNQQKEILYDPKALPRAYVASRCYPSANLEESVAQISAEASFQLGSAIVEEWSDAEASFCKQYQRPLQKVPILKDGGSFVNLEKLKGPAVVVLNDNIYPGWTAVDQISGQQLNIRPTNISFRGVILPEARDYQLHFDYTPWWYRLAWGLVLGALLLMLTMTAQHLRK